MQTILIAHNYTEKSFSAMSYHLAHRLASNGNRVIFISYRPYFDKPFVEKVESGEIIVHSWTNKGRPTTIKDAIWYAKIYLKYRPTVVIAHFAPSTIINIVSKTLSFGKTITINYHHTLLSQIITDTGSNFKKELLVFRKSIILKLFCDIVICPSKFSKDDLATNYKFANGIVVLNPMIDRFKNAKTPLTNKIVISFLGRLDGTKGVLDLVKAFNLYLKANPNTKIVLNIAGTGSEEIGIKTEANKNSKITFFGALSYDKVDDFLLKSHYSIIPSKFDNLPTVGLEAMMNQIPILISHTTGLSEYVTNGAECYKFDANIDSIISVFERVENNFDKQKEMAINARKTYENKFTIKEYCNQMIKIIE